MTAGSPVLSGRRSTAFVALAVVCFLWGTTWIASRQGVRGMPALQLVAIRQFLAGCCFVLFYIFKKASWPRKDQWKKIFLLSLLNLVLTSGLTTIGIKYIPAGLGAIIAAIFPLWIMLLSFIQKNNGIAPRAVAGVLLGFAGVCIIFYDHLKDFLQVDFRFGILISLLGSVSWALGSMYTKKQAADFNPYFSIGLQMIIAGVFIYPFLIATHTAIPFSDIPERSWLAIAYLVIFGSVLSFIAYLYALQRLPTAQVSLYAYINPVVAVLISAWLFEENLTLLIGIGGVVTLYGVYLVNQTFRHISQ